jgi:hypothetical protein
MATYVNDLRLKEISTGDESGTWGTSTNTNLELISEALGYATQQVFGSDADATTTIADGASDPARAMYFKITSAGSLTATRTCTIAPNTISRVMFIENATTGSQSIAISQGSGANVTILSGKTAIIYLDGAGSTAAVFDAMAGVDSNLADDSVTTAKIANDAVTAAKLASDAVVTASIVDDNVTQAKIADDAVGADQLASDAVVTASIVDDAVTAAKIASEPISVGITSVVTATSLTATVNTHVYVSAATQTITLPASPTIGQRVLITVGNFADTVIGRNGSNIMSSGTDFTMDAAYLSIQFIYTDATQGWVMS